MRIEVTSNRIEGFCQISRFRGEQKVISINKLPSGEWFVNEPYCLTDGIEDARIMLECQHAAFEALDEISHADEQIQPDDEETNIEVSFDVIHAGVTQELKILDDTYDEDAIIEGLRSGTLVTTLWFEKGEPSYVDETVSGKHVAEVVTQEIDGEYDDFV